ncbi:hypothetical protein MtrunA17_Chr3g0124571 [Medicago truncatula]|uniref:Transmembrane protein n=1 Tax=Medicago truncatula TaxID=3880 RepID=A0A396IV43_MEDTR|nr:hypothetical protein MtrunA17_Chr3g0124571 [Medicago truncatula]
MIRQANFHCHILLYFFSVAIQSGLALRMVIEVSKFLQFSPKCSKRMFSANRGQRGGRNLL